MTFALGQGRYVWCDADGRTHKADHWDDIPTTVGYLVEFVPDHPPEPHTHEEHEAMGVFPHKLKEVLSRCLQ